MTPFDKAYAFTKKWEGGYVFDPDDPGGETKFGISKRAYPNEDITNLTEDRAKELYKRDYWDVLNCDSRDVGLGMAIFDTAVNCGVARVAIWLTDAKDAETLLSHRRTHYESIVKKNPKLKKFMKGWMNRWNDLHNTISKVQTRSS